MGNSFDKNDLLKNRGYKWWSGEVGRSHSWYVGVEEQNLDSELEFLRKEIYGRDMSLPVYPITPLNKLSKRIGGNRNESLGLSVCP